MMHQSTESLDNEHEPHNDCIGNLEHHVHKVFALVRVPGEDFVYSASIDLFNKLDDYCDEQGMSESKPPFLIKGESGTGKSALLSNWLQRRERSLTRSRGSNSDCFIFWHAVGCSRQSMNVNVVIKRLIVELKDRFEITRPLPKEQERYSWELPRFLDLAAKRGKVIIVIDGLNRLVNNDGSEDSLAWLPLVFPPNVRVLLSVTIPPSVKMRQVGNAVKAMRVLSQFSYAKESFAVRDAVMNDTSSSEPMIIGESAGTNPATPTSKLKGIIMSKTPFASNLPPGSPNTIATNAATTAATTVNNIEIDNSTVTSPGPISKGGSFIGEGETKSTSKKSRILAELDRRGIPYMVMSPLNKQLCRSLVESFIHKSVNAESASLATGPYIASYLNKHTQNIRNSQLLQNKRYEYTRSSMTTTTSQKQTQSLPQQQQEGTAANDEVPGFLLFNNQINALLNHSQGGTPLFLRLFLRCLQYAVSRGYSLWNVYEDWMRARSVPELLIRILRTLENNFTRTRTLAQTACDKTIAAGGLPALKQLYSWHPAFQKVVVEPHRAGTVGGTSMLRSPSNDSGDPIPPSKFMATTARTPTVRQLRRMSTTNTVAGQLQAFLSGEGGEQVALATLAAAATESLAGGASQADESDKNLSSEVQQNLGDQAWFTTEKEANTKLQKGIRHTEESTAAALNTIKQQAIDEGTDLLQALVKSIQSANAVAIAASAFDGPGATRVSQIYSLNQLRARGEDVSLASHSAGEDDSCEGDDEYDSEDDVDSLVSLDERSVTSDHTIHKNTIKITQELIPPSMRSSPYGSAEPSTPTAKAVVGYNSSTGEAMATTTDATALAAQKSAKSPFKALANSLTAAATTANTTSQSHTASTAHPTSAGGGGANTTTTTAGTTDPSEGLHLLPIYLRGGTDTTGFGDILGNALALLYTSRQGLRESELWKMLSLLQYRAERDTHLSLEMKALNHSIVRRTALFFLSEKGYLCDMFKSEDITRTGYITRKQMLNCIHKINNTIKREDVIKTLEFADLHTPSAPVNISSTNLVHYYQDRDLLIANKVHYNKLFVVLGKLNKQLKFAEVAPGKTGALLATATTTNTTTKSHQASAAGSVSVSKNIHSTTATTKMQPSEDDYENFNLSGILQDTNSSSVVEGGSQETDTYLTADTTAAGTAPGEGGTGGGATPKLPIDIQSATNTAATAEQEGDDEESTFSLGPVIEESLLSILSALGVLHDPENKVLILPSDSEPFRQVIYNNYILKRGGGTMAYWHNIIIKHFQTEPNSLRKCEELPWHLQICRKWGALRDCLVDLEAFDIMAKTDLKTELLQYWVLLTEGPLPFPDPHSSDIHAHNHNDTTVESGRPHSGKGYSVVKTSGRKNKDDDGNESTFTHVLRDIDHAMETNISLKDARRRKYQHMAVPFDIVEELNKSMELWVTTYKPNTQRIHHMIIHVAKFLFEFSRNAHISPDFLRLGIDLDSVGMFAAALSEEIQSGETGGNKKTESHLDDDALSLQTTNLSPIKLPAAMTAGTSGALSPQMLGTIARKGNDSVPRPGTAGTVEVPTVLFGDTTKHEAPKFPTSQMLSSNLYHYLRWVWIQFPWIGLHSAPGVATTLKRIRLEEEKHRYDGEKKKHKAGHAHHSASMTLGGGGLLSPSRPGTSGGLTGAPANLTGGIQTTEHTTSQLEESHSIGSSYGNNTDSAMLLRVWNVKKSDPTIPVFVKSANRKLAAIKPRSTLTTGLERNVEVTFDKLYDEITSPSHIAKIRLGFKNKDKYRRPFEEEVQYNKNIPFAYHGTRAMKAGSLFPSYEKTLAESHAKHQLELENEAAQSRGRHKKRPAKRFDVDEALQQQLHNDPKSSSTTTPFMLVELDDEIRRINNDEYLNKHKTENIGGAIIKDENDLEYETMKDRIARIKTIRNKLTVIHNTKVRTIQTLYSQVIHRHETDQQLIDEVVNSEVLLKHLNERNMTMESDMIEAEKIKDGYNELLKVLKNNPPYIEAHIKALEIEVQLAEKQFQELCEHRNKLYHETEMTDQYKRDQLIEKIQYFQHARYEIAVKKKQIMRKTKQLKGPNKRDLNNRRLTKSGKSVGARMRLNSIENTDSSNSDSENSQSENKNLQLTAPVMHFLNALVRKTTFNEAVVKESDHSLEDIKKRFEDDEQLQQQGGVSYSTKNRRLNRMGSIESMNGNLIAQYAAEAVGNVNNAAVTGTVGSATSKIDQNDGENSIGGGSLNSRNAGGSNSSSVAGSQTSRDSNNMRKAVSIGFGPDVYIQEGRRSSGFGSGPGMVASGTFSPPYYVGGGHGPTLSHPSSPQQGAIRRKLPSDQMAQLREAVRNFLPPPTESELRHHHHHHHHSSSHTPKDPFRAQVHRAFDLLLEKTSSSSADELVERFLQGQSLLSSLRKQQTLVDSRVTQLQSEHAELFAVFNDLAFISDDQTAGSTGTTAAAVVAAAGTSSSNTTAQENSSDETAIDNLGSSDRYLDNQLFAREVRLNQIQRKSDHAELIVSDVRAAIGNLINLMNINAKLLHALPKTEAPAITCTEEILTGMSWFEDRIMALSEALAMDANKPTGANTADDNKPLFERQLDLAMLVQKMNLGAPTTPSSRGNSRGQKKRGGISSSLINAEGEDAPFTSSHNAIMVPPVGRIDKIFDNKMARVIAEREKHAEAQEQQLRYSKDDENNSTIIQNFLNEGLNLKETKDLARSANLLVNKRSGRTGSYGLVLENLLVAKGQHFHPTNSAIHAKAKEHSTGSTSLASPSAVHSSVLNNSVFSSGSIKKENTHATTAAGAGSSTHPNTAATTTTDRHSRSSSPVN